MKEKKTNKLLEKYYKGETSLSEEAELKQLLEKDAENYLEEQLAFDFYKEEAKVPNNLEERLFAGIQKREDKPKVIQMNRFRYGSIAATFALVASIFWFASRQSGRAELSNEEQFAIMEEALMEVSFGVQPSQKDELLVLFQDENLEIIAE